MTSEYAAGTADDEVGEYALGGESAQLFALIHIFLFAERYDLFAVDFGCGRACCTAGSMMMRRCRLIL